MSKPIVAIMYDFDKTLSTTDMQNYTFIPSLGITPEEFWSETAKITEKYHVDRILAYMYAMVDIAKRKGITITRKFLRDCGKDIQFYPGVTSWFKRINEYGELKGVKVEHYLVSSGTKEIVEGCAIFKEFTETYGCEFLYNEKGEAIWPSHAINFTQKTQYFFRIAKGATDTCDDDGVNIKTNKLRVPYRNIIYLGDGLTDVACMTLVKKNNGHSIAIYPQKESSKAKEYHNDERVNFICSSDYRNNSDLDKVVKLIIDKISMLEEIDKKEQTLAKK